MCKLIDSPILFMGIQPKVVTEHMNKEEYMNKAHCCFVYNSESNSRERREWLNYYIL